MDSSNTTTDIPMEEIDPNTLWEAADKLTASTPQRVETTRLPNDESMSISNIALNDDPTEAVKGLHKNLSTFWKENETEFRSFWDKMYPKSRENFMRDVYPTIVHSLTDQYCYLDGKKIYERRYDRYLLLTPDLTVANLSIENNFPELVSSLVEEGALSKLSMHMVTLLRKLYKSNYFPFTKSEREAEIRQFNIVKGSTMVVNQPDKFANFISVDKPEYIKKSIGGEVNLFECGIISYPFEFDIVLENLVFMYGMFGAFLDEFRVEVLRQGKGKNVKICSPQYACSFCGTAGSTVKLLACGNCGITMYCSK